MVCGNSGKDTELENQEFVTEREKCSVTVSVQNFAKSKIQCPDVRH